MKFSKIFIFLTFYITLVHVESAPQRLQQGHIQSTCHPTCKFTLPKNVKYCQNYPPILDLTELGRVVCKMTRTARGILEHEIGVAPVETVCDCWLAASGYYRYGPA